MVSASCMRSRMRILIKLMVVWCRLGIRRTSQVGPLELLSTSPLHISMALSGNVPPWGMPDLAIVSGRGLWALCLGSQRPACSYSRGIGTGGHWLALWLRRRVARGGRSGFSGLRRERRREEEKQPEAVIDGQYLHSHIVRYRPIHIWRA